MKRTPALLNDPSLSRITEDEMRNLMITASERLTDLLKLRTESPKDYEQFVRAYNIFYCGSWER